MSFSSGNVAIVSIGGTDVSAYCEKATLTLKRDVMKLPRLGSNPTAHLVGPLDVEIKVEGWIDPTITALLFPLANTTPASTTTLEYQPEGSGGDARTITVYVADYEEESDSKNPNKWMATFTSENGVIS